MEFIVIAVIVIIMLMYGRHGWVDERCPHDTSSESESDSDSESEGELLHLSTIE